jgi:hypothetical protein
MTARTRTVIFSFLLFSFLTCLTAPAMASGTFVDAFDSPYSSMLSADMPSPFTPMLTQLQKELFELSGIKNDITVIVEPCDLQAHAGKMLTELYDDAPDRVLLFYCPADNAVGIAYGENVAAVLTEADEDAIRAAFAAPDTDDGYTHVLNGMKQLNICVFDGGDYDVPDLSYTAQFLREPDAVPISGALPKNMVTPISRDDAWDDIELSYLSDAICCYSGISTAVCVRAAADQFSDSYAADTLNVLERNSEYPPVVMVYTVDSDRAEVLIGDAMGDILPADAADRLKTAMESADGDGYDHALAGLTELAKILFADGTREYDPNSGIALALDPDAFAESGSFSPAVWIAIAAGILIVLAAISVIIARKKRTH